MLAEERGQPHRFNEILEQFPKDIPLEKFLFQDESLLWAQRLPFAYRFRSLGVMLCLVSSLLFIIADIIILIASQSSIRFVVASLPLPLIVLPLRYALHRLLGAQIQVVTNYRVMQCTVKLRSFFIRSLSFHVISGMVVKDSTIEFSIKEDNTFRKKSPEVRSMVFRGVTSVNHLETIVQRQLNSSLSEFQYPPNIDTQVYEHILPERYRNLLPSITRQSDTQNANPNTPSLLWISNLSLFTAHKSIIYNTLLAEAWVACIVFSPALTQPAILDNYIELIVLLMIAVPAIMILFNFLLRVDVLTSNAVAFFSVGLKVCGYGARVDTLDYLRSFPHAITINKSDGSGIIHFENIPSGLVMIEWPDVLSREELIFRQHCLAHSAFNNKDER